jgi:hypothetical protein
MSLNNLGNWLSKLGRHEVALEATEEAGTILRTLTKPQPASTWWRLTRAHRPASPGRHAHARIAVVTG